jgi:hypothetical protein
MEEGFLHLIAPEFDYHQLIVYDFINCRTAAWINEP